MTFEAQLFQQGNFSKFATFFLLRPLISESIKTIYEQEQMANDGLVKLDQLQIIENHLFWNSLQAVAIEE